MILRFLLRNYLSYSYTLKLIKLIQISFLYFILCNYCATSLSSFDPSALDMSLTSSPKCLENKVGT